jgi:hypothetical protein
MTATRYSAPPSSILVMTVLAPRTSPSRNPRTAISSRWLPEKGAFIPRPTLDNVQLRTFLNEGKKGGRRWGAALPSVGVMPTTDPE